MRRVKKKEEATHLSGRSLGARAAYQESKHRRDAEGRYADKPGAGDDAPRKGRRPAAEDDIVGRRSGGAGEETAAESRVRPVEKMSDEEAQGSLEWKNDPERWAAAEAGAEASTHAAPTLGTVSEAEFTPEQKLAVDRMADQLDQMGITHLTSADSSAVKLYTGTSSAYKNINKALRRADTSKLKPAELEAARELQEHMKASVMKRDAVFYRGVEKVGKFDKMPPPSDFADNGFQSTSMNSRFSEKFSGATFDSAAFGEGTTGTMFKIRVPKGSHALSVSRADNVRSGLAESAEVLLPPGTRYRYVSHEVQTRTVPGYGSAPERKFRVKVIEVEVVRADGSGY